MHLQCTSHRETGEAGVDGAAGAEGEEVAKSRGRSRHCGSGAPWSLGQRGLEWCSLGTGAGFGVSLSLRARREARGHCVVGACSSVSLVPASFHTWSQ